MDTTDVHLLKPSEVVELLGVLRSWLYDAAKAGRIPCVRLGGSDGPVRFRARELESWIERGRVVPRTQSPTREKASSEVAEPPDAPADAVQLPLLSDGSS